MAAGRLKQAVSRFPLKIFPREKIPIRDDLARLNAHVLACFAQMR